MDFVEVSGVIDPVSARYLVSQIERANRSGSHLLVVRLDTPGGLDISMRQIVQEMLGSKVPIVVWVAPSGARAGSAGVFITYAAHIAAMAPGTNIGAAHPVNLSGELKGAAAEKAVNDAAALLRSIARQRGRNVEWAEAAVRKSASLEADEAVAQNVADLISGDRSDLLEKLHGQKVNIDGREVALDTRGRPQRSHEMPLLDRILHGVVNPEIAYLLLLFGFYGILFELYSPGLGLGGILGAVSLILGFFALSVLPVSWAGVALLVLAVALFIADVHVAGAGVLTAGGAISLFAGSMLLFSGADPALALSPVTIGVATAASVAFFVFLVAAALRARLSRPISGAEGMIGMQGVARSALAPEGQVMAKGTVWRAYSPGADIPEGSRVRVRRVEGLKLVVEPAGEPAEAPATKEG